MKLAIHAGFIRWCGFDPYADTQEASATDGVVKFFTIQQHISYTHRVRLVRFRMSLFQTKKQHSFKIAKFGTFPLGMTKHTGRGRSVQPRAKYKEFFPSPRLCHCGGAVPGEGPVGIYRK